MIRDLDGITLPSSFGDPLKSEGPLASARGPENFSQFRHSSNFAPSNLPSNISIDSQLLLTSSIIHMYFFSGK